MKPSQSALDMGAYQTAPLDKKIQTLTFWHHAAATTIERQHADIQALLVAISQAQAELTSADDLAPVRSALHTLRSALRNIKTVPQPDERKESRPK
jgi:hypothetical protein